MLSRCDKEEGVLCDISTPQVTWFDAIHLEIDGNPTLTALHQFIYDGEAVSH